MVCEASILLLGLLVQDQVDQVKSGKQSWWELDVLDHGLGGVVLGVDWVCSCEDSSSCVQGANDASLGHRDGLLLHRLVQNIASILVHFVELVDTANTTV